MVFRPTTCPSRSPGVGACCSQCSGRCHQNTCATGIRIALRCHDFAQHQQREHTPVGQHLPGVASAAFFDDLRNSLRLRGFPMRDNMVASTNQTIRYTPAPRLSVNATAPTNVAATPPLTESDRARHASKAIAALAPTAISIGNGVDNIAFGFLLSGGRGAHSFGPLAFALVIQVIEESGRTTPHSNQTQLPLTGQPLDARVPLSLLEAVRTIDTPDSELEAELVHELRNNGSGSARLSSRKFVATTNWCASRSVWRTTKCSRSRA